MREIQEVIDMMESSKKVIEEKTYNYKARQVPNRQKVKRVVKRRKLWFEKNSE